MTILDALAPTPENIFGLWIGNQWSKGSNSALLEVRDPGNDQVIAAVTDASVDEAVSAVDAAAAAANDWAARAPRERGEVLRRAFELMQARRDEFAALIVRENGKTWQDAQGEVTYAAEFFRWFAEEAVRANGELAVAPSGRNKILTMLEPVGVSVLITPWNFPAAMATRKIAPALAAGCTCVLKPAAETPLTALAVAQLLHDAGLPDGVLNVVTTRRSAPVVKAMLQHEQTRKLSFTGSTEVGRLLLAEASARVLNTSMELGGNAPFIVFEDANVEAAVEAALVAKMRNGGASCIAANRFLVSNRVAPEFTERLAHAMGNLRIGHGLDRANQLGAMINRKAADALLRVVDEAIQGGADRIVGGELLEGPGAFLTPTVVSSLPPDAAILREELFGPVASIVTFEDEKEAITIANGTEVGLASYVFTEDLTRAMRVATRLEAGMVGVNRGFISDPAAPFGGVKQSGIGREGAHVGMLEFMEHKYVAVDW